MPIERSGEGVGDGVIADCGLWIDDWSIPNRQSSIVNPHSPAPKRGRGTHPPASSSTRSFRLEDFIHAERCTAHRM